MALPRDPLYAEIASLRDTIALRDEQLRQMTEAFMPRRSFPRAWCLTAQETAMLSALHARRAPVLSKEALHIAISGLEVETDIKMVDVIICKLRSKLKPFGIAIETRWGRGYQLPPASRQIIDTALKAAISEYAPPAESL